MRHTLFKMMGLTHVPCDVNGVLFTGNVSSVLAEAAKAKGYVMPMWISESALALRAQIPKPNEVPITVPMGPGAFLTLFNEEQLEIPEIKVPMTIPPSNINGVPFTEKFQVLLLDHSAQNGFFNPFWLTADRLKVFGTRLCDDAVGITRSFTPPGQGTVTQTFYNAQQTLHPYLFTPANCHHEFVVLPRHKLIQGRQRDALHAHAIRHKFSNKSAFWGSKKVIESYGVPLQPDAIGCGVSVPVFRLVYNGAQTVDVDAFNNKLTSPKAI